MTTTYKKLASYFLTRGTSSGGSGYYYGEEDLPGLMPIDFNSIKTDLGFISNFVVQSDQFVPTIWSIALQPDGKIVIGGQFSTVGGVTRNHIARLNSDGTLDTGFNPNANNRVSSIAIQPDGKIVIAGFFGTVGGVTRNRIARLNSDGTLDTGFNPNANDIVYSIALQPDGKIVIGGEFTTVGGVTRNRIARLNSDGTLDTGFNPNANNRVNSIAIQPDGKIVIGGEFTTVGGVTRIRIARLNSDGTLDTGFNPNANNRVNSIAIQPDGKIVIGGWFGTVGGVTRNRIARLNSDGTLDTGFNPNADGFNQTELNVVHAIAIQPDGKIIVVGVFTAIGGVARNNIARLNSDGTLDTNFSTRVTGVSGVYSIALQPDGKIIIGGWFNTVGGVGRVDIARLKEVVSNAPYRLAYTVPENTQVIVKNIFATNHNSFPVFHDIAVLPMLDEMAGISEKHYYVWDDFIDDNGYNIVDGGITLSAGDEIYVYSSTDENISYNIFGVEIEQ